MLEQGTVDLLRELGVSARMDAEAIEHGGIHLQFAGGRHHVPMRELTGRGITIWGQTEVVKDLIAARIEAALPLRFDVEDVTVHDVETERPRVRYRRAGADHELECDAIAGCDGSHGVCRPSIPAGALREFSREYPYGWLGILAAVEPSIEELVYAHHARGFALLASVADALSLLRAGRARRGRCELARRADLGGTAGTHGTRWLDASRWPDPREGCHRDAELRRRADAARPAVPRRRRVAHRAADRRQGLNLAISDVAILGEALVALCRDGDATALASYSARALRRIWRAEHFSWWMTSMLHRPPEGDPFEERLQLAQLRYVTGSDAAATSLAENYVGLPGADLGRGRSELAPSVDGPARADVRELCEDRLS